MGKLLLFLFLGSLMNVCYGEEKQEKTFSSYEVPVQQPHQIESSTGKLWNDGLSPADKHSLHAEAPEQVGSIPKRSSRQSWASFLPFVNTIDSQTKVHSGLFSHVAGNIKANLDLVKQRQDVLLKFAETACPNSDNCQRVPEMDDGSFDEYRLFSWLFDKSSPIVGVDKLFAVMNTFKNSVEKLTLRQNVLFEHVSCSCNKDNECNANIKPILEVMFSNNAYISGELVNSLISGSKASTASVFLHYIANLINKLPNISGWIGSHLNFFNPLSSILGSNIIGGALNHFTKPGGGSGGGGGVGGGFWSNFFGAHKPSPSLGTSNQGQSGPVAIGGGGYAGIGSGSVGGVGGIGGSSGYGGFGGVGGSAGSGALSGIGGSAGVGGVSGESFPGAGGSIGSSGFGGFGSAGGSSGGTGGFGGSSGYGGISGTGVSGGIGGGAGVNFGIPGGFGGSPGFGGFGGAGVGAGLGGGPGGSFGGFGGAGGGVGVGGGNFGGFGGSPGLGGFGGGGGGNFGGFGGSPGFSGYGGVGGGTFGGYGGSPGFGGFGGVGGSSGALGGGFGGGFGGGLGATGGSVGSIGSLGGGAGGSQGSTSAGGIGNIGGSGGGGVTFGGGGLGGSWNSGGSSISNLGSSSPGGIVFSKPGGSSTHVSSMEGYTSSSSEAENSGNVNSGGSVYTSSGGDSGKPSSGHHTINNPGGGTTHVSYSTDGSGSSVAVSSSSEDKNTKRESV